MRILTTARKKVALSGLLLASSVAFAADFKLGYVDVSKIFTQSPPAVALQDALKVKLSPMQQELKNMNDNLVKEQGQMQDIMKQAPSMDKLAKADQTKLEGLEAKYQKDQIAFQQKYSAYGQYAQKMQDAASGLLLGKVNAIIKQISDNGSYDLVMTSTQLVYAKAKYDITDQVIEQLKSVNATDLVKQLTDAEKLATAAPGTMPGSAPAASTPSAANGINPLVAK